MAMPNILIVDDEAYISTQLEEHLTSMGYDVAGMTSSGEASIEMAKSLHPDLILMDIVLPGKLDGIAAAQIIKEEQDIPVIFLTAYTDDKLIERAKNVEPYGYIVKPFQKREIKAAIEVALYKKETEEALQRAHDELERRVEERTAELTKANEELKAEIVERKQAEGALRKSEERYRSLYESNQDGIAGGDMEGNILECNQAYADMLGYTKEEIMKLAYQQLTPKKWQKMEANIVKNQIAKRGYSDEYEKGYIRKDGTILPVSCRVWLRKDEKGQPLGMWGIARDITVQKQAEEALRKREEELVIKTNSLEEVNAALRVLLKGRDEDRTELEEKTLFNVKELVVPFLERLKKSKLDPKQVSYIDILESNLNNIISPFSRTLSTKYLSLTPKEIQIANLIKEGKSTKEIGEVMVLSPRTIETHRKNMRRKLGLEKRKGNLRSHLLTFQ
jgi:PAS domain S-box-containing protein